MAFFPEDGVVEDSGRRFVGHAAIRRWNEREFIGANGRMKVTAVNETKNGVAVMADWVSEYFTGPSRFVFVLRGGQVQELRIAGA